jgi:3-methyladenine DNA glycosylase AlkD
VRAADVVKALQQVASPERAKNSEWFFKTGPGQYGEGDVFIGVTVPNQRKVAKQYVGLSFGEVEKLLLSPVHEERLTGLLILVYRFKKSDEQARGEIYDFYMAHTKRVNNWDLVDSSASNIVGAYLADKDRAVLYELARSDNLWERRIAIIATAHFISLGESKDTFAIAEILLGDTHDLIHKAVGWMLREVGKNCGQEAEEEFLKKHYRVMPRTMLRYAIERFDEPLRQQYLRGEV